MLLKDGTAIRILKPHEHVKYLGKQLNLINHTDRDIEERIRKGWVKFSEFRPQVCAKGVSKKQKWLLFESVITSTVLYGSSSWIMNNERIQRPIKNGTADAGYALVEVGCQVGGRAANG